MTEQTCAARAPRARARPAGARPLRRSGSADILQGNFGYSVVNKQHGQRGDRPPAAADAAAHGRRRSSSGRSSASSFGILAAVRQYSFVDYLLTAFSTSFIAIPGFVVGPRADLRLRRGTQDPADDRDVDPGQAATSIQDLLAHMVMPVTLLAVASRRAADALHARRACSRCIGSEYVTTARSKGIRGRARPVAPRLPQRADPDHHDRRADPAGPRRRRRHHRVAVRLAGHGPAGGEGRAPAATPR